MKDILISVSSGLLVALIAIWIGYRLQKRRERELGAEDKPELVVTAYSQQLRAESGIDELIFLLGKIDLGIRDKVFCQVPFCIRNVGQLTAHDVKFTVAWPLSVKEDIENAGIELNKMGPAREEEYHASDESRPPYHYRTHFVKSIGPGDTVVLVDMISVAHISGFPLEVDSQTSDGIPVKASLFVPVKLMPARAVLRSRDSYAQESSFVVKSFCLETAEELVEELKEKDEINDPESSDGCWIQSLVIRPKLKVVDKPDVMNELDVSIYMQDGGDTMLSLISRWEIAERKPRSN